MGGCWVGFEDGVCGSMGEGGSCSRWRQGGWEYRVKGNFGRGERGWWMSI